MSIYIMHSKNFGNNVKVGITYDPVNRIKNIQTGNPEPVRYVRIYTITNSNNITLKGIEDSIRDAFYRLNYCSMDFQQGECKPTEFYSSEIIANLDIYMECIKNHNYIDYVKFENINDFKDKEDELFDSDLYDILKGIDMDYE